MSIQDNMKALRLKVEKNGNCKIVAVSKTKTPADIMEAYNANQRAFGENKAQELADKYEKLPKDIEWHMIGHLQRNKVKYIAPFVYMIQSVDSLRLLEEINKQAARNGRKIRCLLQAHIAEEETKFGFSLDELKALFQTNQLAQYESIFIAGLMGMATFTSDENQVRREFRSLKNTFEELRALPLTANAKMEDLSMGMSGDYAIAIEEGSTIVRVGSAIFGGRS